MFSPSTSRRDHWRPIRSWRWWGDRFGCPEGTGLGPWDTPESVRPAIGISKWIITNNLVIDISFMPSILKVSTKDEFNLKIIKNLFSCDSDLTNIFVRLYVCTYSTLTHFIFLINHLSYQSTFSSINFPINKLFSSLAQLITTCKTFRLVF